MPALLDVQRQLRAALTRDAGDAASALFDGPGIAERLGIYRHTVQGALLKSLRLSYPAVERLVGAAFFEAAAHEFLHSARPHSAYLNDFGAQWPAFLASFEPAASLDYLPDVARLEWAVSRALHAPEMPALSLSTLSQLAPAQWPQLRLLPQPALSVLALQYEAEQIWRAVLARDDSALSALQLRRAPVWLLIERAAEGVQVQRLEASVFEFTARLCAGARLADALGDAPASSISTALAEHLAAGRFTHFELDPSSPSGGSLP